MAYTSSSSQQSLLPILYDSLGVTFHTKQPNVEPVWHQPGMTHHSRSRSKGALSIFSIDTFRSSSRTGSRAVSRARLTHGFDDFARSPSSLSRCDPNAQLPPSPAPACPSDFPTARCGIAHSDSTKEPTQNLFTTNSGATNKLSSDVSKRGRPFSWIFLRTPTKALKKRSMSVNFPKDVSSSTVTRSVISTPILTCTTNVKIAEAEGVDYGELTQDTLDKGTWSPKRGWLKIPHRTAAEEARNLADRIRKEEKHTPRPRRRLQKLGDALLGKLRKNEDHSIEDCGSLNNRIARRRAETVNLCKEKIKDLTGNGLIRRKSVDAKPDKRAVPEDPPLLKKTSLATLSLDEDKDSQYGSLSRSFNSALEKSGIAATTNMCFLKSKSSLFNTSKDRAPQPVVIPSAHPAGPPEAGQERNLKQYHYSPGKGGYIPAPPFPGYPNGVNGLRMHGNTSVLATRHYENENIDMFQGATEQALDTADGSSLDEAPMFSPSMGNLSQYSTTPTTKKTHAASVSTPTKIMTLTKRKSERNKLSKSAIGERAVNHSSKENRSKTLNLSRQETPPPATSIKESPYKPTTPSPLRNEATLQHSSRLARSTNSPRSPENQAKRFGVFGLPSPRQEDQEW